MMKKRNLLSKIRREFPNLKWERALHNLQGDDHYVLMLDDKYVFRFPREARYQEKLKYEASLLKHLSKHLNLSIPDYAFVPKDRTFAGYSMIPGVQLSRKVFKNLPKKAKTNIARQLAEFLSTLHKTPIKIARKHHVRIGDIHRSYAALVKHAERYIKPRISRHDYSLINEFLEEFHRFKKYPRKCLAHCDLYLHHLLLNPRHKQLEGVIDFSDMCIDDPALDFSELWFYGRGFVELVYKNYNGPKDKEFLRRSILYCKRVPVFMMTFPFVGLGSSFALGRNLFREIYAKGFFK